MTTFVPLAADIDGTVSAVAVGDWLWNLIKLKRPEQSASFYAEFVDLAQTLDPATNEHVDPLGLFKLLLSQEELVFCWLAEALTKGEVVAVAAAAEPASAPATTQQIPAVAGATTASTVTAPAVASSAAGTVPAVVAEGVPVGSGREAKQSFQEASREVEEVFGVLMSMLVLRVKEPEDAGRAAGQLCEVIKKSTKPFPEFGLKLLMSLYNVFGPSFPYRFPIFVAILDFAAEHNLFHKLLPYIAYVDQWIGDWNISVISQRRIFSTISREYKKMGKIAESYPFLRRYIEGFEGEDESVLQHSDTIEAAAELAADSLRLPTVMYFDKLFELDAFKELRKSPAHKDLIELVEVFLKGGPTELKKVHEQHVKLFEQYELDYDVCLDKIRLLALAARCVGYAELSMKQLGDSVALPHDDGQLEQLLVRAIGQGLVDAKIDQINKTVQIKSVSVFCWAKLVCMRYLTLLSSSNIVGGEPTIWSKSVE
eukprot:GHVS01057323.1.p1 GENE.GHVS01057323.1~~GHVS01057323.1.p1  ORF type:complete len:483 (+),score=89.21 GHVS01057323.1:2-1450(+)